MSTQCATIELPSNGRRKICAGDGGYDGDDLVRLIPVELVQFLPRD